MFRLIVGIWDTAEKKIVESVIKLPDCVNPLEAHKVAETYLSTTKLQLNYAYLVELNFENLKDIKINA